MFADPMHRAMATQYREVARAPAEQFPSRPGVTSDTDRVNFRGRPVPPRLEGSGRRSVCFRTPRFPFPVGRDSAAGLYPWPDRLAGIPGAVLDRFVGVGNPFTLGVPRPGWHVLDVGCGAGLDTLMAAELVGPGGRVIGVDLNPEMLAVAEEGNAECGIENVEFRAGLAEELPVESGWADLVIANAAIGLTAAPGRAFAEVARVLRPGGGLQAAELVLDDHEPVPEALRWTH